MSARPRPVTATFIPDHLKPPTLGPTTKFDVSSGSSTASLCSVLDHDSYDSADFSDSDHEEGRDENKNENSKRKVNFPDSDLVSAVNSVSLKTSESQVSVTSQESDLSPWEKWLVEKAKIEREEKERIKLEKQKKKEAKEKKKLEEEKKLQKSTEKYKEWVENKQLKEKLQKENMERTKSRLEEEEEAKKKKIEEKAKQEYEEWLKKKEERRKQAILKEKEEQRKKEEEKKLKQKKCEEAYEEWSKKAVQRPKSAQSSFGYTTGKLTGYHDRGSYPAPSFYNPLPWQPIHVPQPSSGKKKRPKSTRLRSAKNRSRHIPCAYR